MEAVGVRRLVALLPENVQSDSSRLAQSTMSIFVGDRSSTGSVLASAEKTQIITQPVSALWPCHDDVREALTSIPSSPR
jgi:hypothetical protein